MNAQCFIEFIKHVRIVSLFRNEFNLINSIIQEHECYVLFITGHQNYLKITFVMCKHKDFAIIFTQHYNGRHYTMLLNL